jgi:hypothetical protein
MNVLAGQASKRPGSFEYGVQVVDYEVQRLCSRVRLSNRRNIDDLQGNRTAGKVDAGACLFSTFESEQLAVEFSGLIEVPDLDIDAKQTGYVGIGDFGA